MIIVLSIIVLIIVKGSKKALYRKLTLRQNPFADVILLIKLFIKPL